MKEKEQPRSGEVVAGQLALVLALFAAAYFLSLFFRTVNAVIAPELSSDLGLDAETLGLLTAAYFIGLGMMQIPLGIVLDRYGPRLVQACLLLIAAAGAILFAFAHDIWVLVLARTLVGIGAAGGLMAALHVAALWLPKEQLPLANGCYLAVGGLGVLASTAPVEFALGFISWRTVFGAMAAVTMLLAVLIYSNVPEASRRPGPLRAKEGLFNLHRVVADPVLWRYAPLSAACFATGTSMQSLWAGEWLRDVDMLDRSATALYLTTMAVALIIGSVAGGAISIFIGRFGLNVRHVVVSAAALFMFSEIGLIFAPQWASAAFWMLFALTYNAVTLSYAVLAQHFPAAYVGRAMAVMNGIVIFSTFLIQYGFGLMIGLWEGTGDQGLPPIAYKSSLSVLLLVQALSFVWLLWGDTHRNIQHRL